MAARKRERLITVCDSCLRASCWHGDFYCDEHKEAGTKDLTESELAALGYEHPSNYSQERVEKICGRTDYAQ